MSSSSSSYGFDQVNISFLESGDTDNPTKTLPLIIAPRWNDSLEFLVKFLEINRKWAEEQILQYGVILIRGFQINDAVAFEKAVNTLQPNLCDTYRGTSPRTLASGTKFAFSAADVPVNYPIAQHLEMSFLPSPPRQLYFGCMKASNCAGGETALCDFRKVYQDISPELRNKLETKKIKYTRMHYKVGEKYTYDVGAMLGWPALFGTSDPTEVERMCAQEGAPPVQWVGPNKDTFLQEWIDEPFQKHPVTNELVWFNHSQVFHWTTFPAELWFSFQRVKDFHLLIHCILIAIFSFIKYGLLGYKMALNTTFGDGTPITALEMTEIRDAIHKNMVFSRWRKGDIMCIDNFSTSHGRQPTYDMGRKVIVAWSQPHNKTLPDPDLLPKLQQVQEETSTSSFLPDLVACSPETTLTSTDAQKLKVAFHGKNMEEKMIKSFAKHHTVRASCPAIFGSNTDFWKAIKAE